MVINFDFQLKGLDGIPIAGSEGHAGMLLGNLLASAFEGDKMKFYGWAVKLYSKQQLDIDFSDFEKIKKFITNHKNMTAICEGQLLEYLLTVK